MGIPSSILQLQNSEVWAGHAPRGGTSDDSTRAGVMLPGASDWENICRLQPEQLPESTLCAASAESSRPVDTF
jgi:hypothetical protein